MNIPCVPIDTTHELTIGEQNIADRLAKARYKNARGNNVKNLKMGDQSNEQTDQNGMGAEIGFCHLFGTRPDLSVSLRSATNGTDPYDTTFEQLGDLPVDVKHTDWLNGRLLAMLTKQSGDYLFALMNGCYPFLRDECYNHCVRQYLEDPRKTGLKNGLRQLTIPQLKRVIEWPGEMVLDSCNYEDGKFCALAIGVGLDAMPDPSHNKVYSALIDLGYSVYNTRGIKGEFYTENRKEDLLLAAREVLAEKVN